MTSTFLNMGRKKRVVIVDDSRTMRAALEQVMSLRLGLDVVGMAGDVDSAVTMIASLQPDLVTIDLMMPYIDGKVLLERLIDFPAVHKIVVSAHASANLAIVSMLEQLGADACLDKSELSREPERFCSKVQAVLAKPKRGAQRAERATPMKPRYPLVPATSYPVPLDEHERLKLLPQLELANDDEDAQLDQITRHLGRVTDFSTCLMTFIDSDRQWIKSAHGFARGFTERAHAFCNYTLCADGEMIVGDATKDDRFCRNPLVVDAPGIRTYVGHPITNRSGVRLGVICLIDSRPRRVLPSVITNIRGMCEIAGSIIDARSVPLRRTA